MPTLTITTEEQTKQWHTNYSMACAIARKELNLSEEEHRQIMEMGEVETENGKAVVGKLESGWFDSPK